MTLLSLSMTADADDNSGNTGFGLLSAIVLISGFFINAGTRVFTRFQNVTIAQSSNISQADYSVVAVDTDSSTTYNCNIYCNAADNASNPANGSALMALSLTSSSTNVSGLNTTNGVRYTYNIANAVQEVINRGGWSSGNAIMPLWVDNGSSTNRRWNDYNNGGVSVAAKLDITYTDPVRSQVPYHRRNTIRAMLRR